VKDQLRGIKLWIGVSLLAGSIWTGAAVGSVFATGSTTAPPANDNFANAIVLTGQNVSSLGGTNFEATLELGEDPNIAERPASHTIWYSWTPTSNGQVTIDTATSGFDTLLGVYTGNAIDSLSEVKSDDDSGPDETSMVTFNVTAATTYRIRVDGFDTATGTVNLHVNEVLPPANDDFANAVVLSGSTITRTGDANLAATLEAGEDSSVAGSLGGASVWYRWTPAASGPVTIDTETSDFDTLLGVYTGGSVGALSSVATNDDRSGGICNVTSAVTFAAVAGTPYRIRVDGFGGSTGAIRLHLAPGTSMVPCAPRNPTTTAAAGQATVSWVAPASDGGSAITGYEVTSYAGGVAQGTIAVGNVTESTVSGLVNGTTYTFRVAAKNAAGTGPQSSASNAVTPLAVPDAPANVTASPGAGQATVGWSAPFNGGSAITGYVVTRYVGGVEQGTTSLGVVTQTTVSGLANGTTYTFRAAAVNALGTGAQSAASNPVTPRTVPEAPINVSATGGTRQATVTWSPPASDGGDAISGYDVTSYVTGIAQGTTTVGAVTQATVGGLTNGTTYTFRVAAKNGVGTGAQSADSNAVTPAAQRFTLTVSKTEAGAGIVTSSSGGITCGTSCAADFDAGTSLTLTAIAASGSTFAGWSGACTGTGPCAVTMDATKAVTAAFVPQPRSRPVIVRWCTVPKVIRKTLATAKRRIAAAHCRTGRVTRAKSKTVAKGRVISQRPRAGRKLASGTKVHLVISRGRR